METIKELTYGILIDALKELGFKPDLKAMRSRTLVHPTTQAKIILPPGGADEPLRAYHLVATRGALADYGLIAPHDFDLLLLRLSSSVTHKAVVA